MRESREGSLLGVGRPAQNSGGKQPQEHWGRGRGKGRRGEDGGRGREVGTTWGIGKCYWVNGDGV